MRRALRKLYGLELNRFYDTEALVWESIHQKSVVGTLDLERVRRSGLGGAWSDLGELDLRWKLQQMEAQFYIYISGNSEYVVNEMLESIQLVRREGAGHYRAQIQRAFLGEAARLYISWDSQRARAQVEEMNLEAFNRLSIGADTNKVLLESSRANPQLGGDGSALLNGETYSPRRARGKGTMKKCAQLEREKGTKRDKIHSHRGAGWGEDDHLAGRY